MAIFLPQRWRQQPQTLLQVDWGNSLSRGLCSAWHPAASQYIGPGLSPYPTPNNFSYQSDPAGRGVRFNGVLATEPTPSGRIALPAGSAGSSTSYSGTRLVLFRLYGNQWGLVSGKVAGTLGMRLAGTTQVSLVSASNVVVGSGTIPVSSNPTIALCTADNVTTQTRLHINGQLVFSGTSGYTNSSDGLWVGAITNHGSDSNFFLALSWDRPLSISESAAIQENPWQIFKPNPVRTYSLPAIVTPFKGGRFLPQRWKAQPQGNIEIDWNNPLTKGLFLAAAPGVSGKAFHRFPTNDPNWAAGNIGPLLRYQSGGRFRATPFGAGFTGNVLYTTRVGGNATYSLVDVLSGGSPVYTYGVAYCQLDTPDSEFSGFSYTNGQTNFSLQANNVSTQFIARNWTAEIDTTANDHFITVPGGVPNQKQLTSTVTWAVGQPGRIYNGKQLLVSSNATVWDGGYFAYNNPYFASYSTGKTSGLLGVTWLRALTDNDRAAFDENPWQIFKPKPGRIYFLPGMTKRGKFLFLFN
jgi:hypothetical protein